MSQFLLTLNSLFDIKSQVHVLFCHRNIRASYEHTRPIYTPTIHKRNEFSFLFILLLWLTYVFPWFDEILHIQFVNVLSYFVWTVNVCVRDIVSVSVYLMWLCVWVSECMHLHVYVSIPNVSEQTTFVAVKYHYCCYLGPLMLAVSVLQHLFSYFFLYILLRSSTPWI